MKLQRTKSYKDVLGAIFFVLFLFIQILDLHAISHILGSDDLDNKIECEICLISEQSEDLNYISTLDNENPFHTGFQNYAKPTLGKQNVKTKITSLFYSNFLNKPPPSIA